MPAHLLWVTVPRARVPKGAPAGTGGRFTVTTRVEPALALMNGSSSGVDRYGFPVVVCARCDGRGRHGHNAVDADRCYGCGGTGHQYTPDVLRGVVAEFSAAQRAAARPHVSDLRVGDSVSRLYTQLSEAQFKHVAKVLVSGHRATRFEGNGEGRRPVAFAASVEYTDGTRDAVTTDAVYARRGHHVDPAPFVARASRKTTGPVRNP